MSEQQSLGLKLGQPVETKPAGEPVKSEWWLREIYKVAFKYPNRNEEAEVLIAEGAVVELRPALFRLQFPDLIGCRVEDRPLLGEQCEMTVRSSDGFSRTKFECVLLRIERDNVGASKWWQTEHFRIWFEQGSEESERAIEFIDGKVVALVPGWYAKLHADLVGKALLSEPAVRKLLEVAGADLQPPTWIERHVDHPLMTAEAFLSESGAVGSLDYIHKQRGMPWVEFGMVVEVDGKRGRVVGGNTNGNLNVLFDGEQRFSNCHPKWKTRFFRDGTIIAIDGELLDTGSTT